VSDGLRIVYLSLETLRPGQAAHTHVHAIVTKLRRRGHEVTLVAPEPTGPEECSVLRRVLRYLPLQLRAARTLRHVDCAYIRAHPFAFPFAALCRAFAIPVVHEINGRAGDLGVTYPWLGRVLGLMARWQIWQYRTAAGLIAVTPGLATWARQRVPADTPVVVVPNGADLCIFQPEARPLRPIAGPYVIFFGGLVKWHGVATMIRAVSDPSWPKRVRLVVAGTGRERPLVETAARAGDAIVVLGFLPQDELAGLVACALASLVPIEDEGERAVGGVAPVKLFESLAAGCPVIATDLPFQAGLVRESGSGLVIPPADSVALAQAVANLARSPDTARAMGAKGRRFVSLQHSWEARGRETETFLKRVAGREPSGPEYRER
jgi:glycosyltransferase involved in cell wall biosynthesis